MSHNQPSDGVVFEAVACELCGADLPEPLIARHDMILGGRRIYQMQRCGNCGAVYQYPRPTAATIGLLYPPIYPQYTQGVHTESWLRRIDRRYGLWKRCKAVTRHVKRGRLLDVGCATGDFLSEMQRQRGWTVAGIEPTHVAASYAHNEVGLSVTEGVLNDAPFASQSFDAITLWDVLEHVYNPKAVIAEAARLLRPGGVIVINHPNLDSLDRKLFRRYWIGYELPRHIYLFPTQLLRKLMAEHGLVEVERSCFYGSHAATGTSLTFVIQALFGEQIAAKVRRWFFNKIVRVLLVPYFWLIDRQRLGSNVTVVFQKPV